MKNIILTISGFTFGYALSCIHTKHYKEGLIVALISSFVGIFGFIFRNYIKN